MATQVSKFLLKQMSRKELIRACRKMIQTLDYFEGTLRMVGMAEQRLDDAATNEEAVRCQDNLADRYGAHAGAARDLQTTFSKLEATMTLFASIHKLTQENSNKKETN